MGKSLRPHSPPSGPCFINSEIAQKHYKSARAESKFGNQRWITTVGVAGRLWVSYRLLPLRGSLRPIKRPSNANGSSRKALT